MNKGAKTPKTPPRAALLRAALLSALLCVFLTTSGDLAAQFGGTPARPKPKPQHRLSVENREQIIARDLEGYSAALNETLAAFRVPVEAAAERLRALRAALAPRKVDAKRIADLEKSLANDRAILAALKTRKEALAALDTVVGFVPSGRADGPFAPLHQQHLIGPIRCIDTNADGLDDIVIISHCEGVKVHLADAQGGWTLSAPKYPEGEYIVTARIADFNGDGHLDIVGLYSKSLVLVHLSDGKGGWTTSPMDPALKGTVFGNIALADFDGDKKIDIAVSHQRTRNSTTGGPIIYRGMGNGTFQKWNVPRLIQSKKDIDYGCSGFLPADLNADGNVDLVVAHRGKVGDRHNLDAVWFGDGRGRFRRASVGLSFGRLPWEAIACAEAADLNGDGHPDLALCYSAVSEYMPHGVQACLGNGQGVWQPASEGLPPDPTHDIELADVDGDGNIDVIAAAKDRVIVALGDGAGRWRMLPPMPVKDRRERVRCITVADIDGDGRKDILIATGGSYRAITSGIAAFSGASKSKIDSRIVLWLNRPAGAAAIERIDAIDAEIAKLGIAPAPAVAPPAVPNPPKSPKAAPTPVNVDKMCEMLGSRYHDDRLNASVALLAAGESVLPKIKKGLDDANPQMRASCIDLLALFGDVSEFPRIATIALDTKETPLVKRHALRALDLLDPLGTRVKSLGGALAPRITAAIKRNDPDGKWKYEIEAVLLPIFVNYGVIDREEYDRVVGKIKREIRDKLVRGQTQEALIQCHEVFGFSRGALVKVAWDDRVVVERPADAEIERIVTGNLKRYRAIFDITAGMKFRKIMRRSNAAALGAFLWEYSFTTVAPRALAVLVATEYERCAYLKVVMDWRRYPWLHGTSALTTRLLVLASLLQFGLDDEARTLADAIAASDPDARIRVMGKETPVADYVKSLFENSGEAARAAAQPDPGSVGNPYPAPKGPGVASGYALWTRHLGAAYPTVSAFDRSGKTFVPWDEEMLEKTTKRGAYPFALHGRRPAGAYPYFPVSDGENVIFNNGVSAWCVSARDGKTLWRYDNPIDSVDLLHKLRYVPLDRSVKYPYSLIVPSHGVVYVVMENYDSVAKALEKFQPAQNKTDLKNLRNIQKNAVSTGSTVICLDLATGRRLWKSAATFGNFGKARVRSPLRFADGRVLFTASSDTILGGVHGITFELVALDADNGRLVWSKSVGDWRAGLARVSRRFAFSGGNYYYDMIAPPPMVVSGNAIIETGGMLASISVCDGRVNWITRFRESPLVREKSIRSRTGRMATGDGKSVARTETALVRPPLICGDKIYIMPNGSEHLMAYDLVSGRLLWMRRVASSRTGASASWSPTFIKRDYSDMLAGPDGTVCLFGPAGVALVDADGMVLWRSAETALDGSPVIGRKCVAVPVGGDAVAYLALKDGRRVGTARIDVERLLKSRARKLMVALANKADPEKSRDDWLELMGVCTESSAIVEQIAAEEKNSRRKAKFDALVVRLKLHLGSVWVDSKGRFDDAPAQDSSKPPGLMPGSGMGGAGPVKKHSTGGNLLLVGGRLYYATRSGFLIALAG